MANGLKALYQGDGDPERGEEPVTDSALAPMSEVPDLSDCETDDERIEAIQTWFLENFEDPANETPYDGREGGYQYIWGGPFDLWEEMGEAFGDQVEPEIIDAAAEGLSDRGHEWAPAGHRIQYPERDEEERPTIDERLDALGGQLEKVEQMVEKFHDLLAAQAPPPGVGHNNPPADEAIPGNIELLELKQSIADVNNELAKRRAGAANDEQVLEVAQRRFFNFRKRVIALGKLIAAGTITGLSAIIAKTIFETLGGVQLVTDVTITIGSWLAHINPPV